MERRFKVREYAWDAILVQNGQDDFGVISAESEEEAIKKLEGCGYTDVIIRNKDCSPCADEGMTIEF